MKKLLGFLAMAAAVCGAMDVMIEAKDMAYELGDEWQCSTSGVLVSKTKNVVAQGTYAMPEAGKYTVWVNTETRNEGWRKGQIKINGASFGKFGDEKMADFAGPKFYWKKMLMPLEVKASGEVVKVEIVSIGSMVRFGGVIFSTNADFDPNKVEGGVKDAVEVLENAE
ncbi:MAG: hypothetical protein MJ016_08375 [Victivallaceae bacterium]|nr:hypothetical protein [Victivallaceae bacterium]